MKKKVETYPRLNKPMVYVAPLYAYGTAPLSYVFGVTNYLPDDMALDWMQRSAAPDAPWRPTEVVRLESGEPVLPDNLFARELLADFDYSTPVFGPRVQSAFIKRFDGMGYIAALNSAMMAWLREGPMPENGYPEGLGAIWRTGRGTCVVDLDLHAKNFQLMVVQVSVSDFMRASDNLAGSKAALEEHAQEWSSADAKFRSPQETTSRYLAERDSMRERVRRQYFRNPVEALLRLPVVRSALYRRARTAVPPVTTDYVIEQATQSALVQELPRVVIAQFVRHFTAVSPPLTQAGLDDCLSRIRRQVVHATTWALQKSIVDDLVDDPEWLAGYHRDYQRERRWRSTHRALRKLRRVELQPIEDVEGEVPVFQPDRLEEQERQRLASLILTRLTGQQRDLADAIMNRGMSPTDWARTAGKDPNYGHVLLSKMRSKVRAFIE